MNGYRNEDFLIPFQALQPADFAARYYFINRKKIIPLHDDFRINVSEVRTPKLGNIR